MDPAQVRVASPAEVANVALALYAPTLSAEGVTRLLERVVVELGLAAEAVYLPAAMVWSDGAPAVHVPAAGGGVVNLDAVEAEGAVPGDVVVARRDGFVEGVLRCVDIREDARAVVQALTAHAGEALTKLGRLHRLGQREAAARRIAEHLQDALLPPLPANSTVGLAMRYRAAAREARVGGDFYDVFPLPDGRLHLVIGDVVGKGLDAAVRTTQITQTLRALAMQDMPLGRMLDRCDEQVTYQDPEIMATVWCGRYEPDTGELEFTSLGHPPALLLRAEGEPIRLELEGLPLGMRDLSVAPPELRRRRLAPRDLLVLYTDGVVEASRDYLAGQESLLAAIARRRDEPLDTLVQEAVNELVAGDNHRDDALMLLLRRR